MSRGRSFLVLLCHARVAQDGARLSAALLGVDDAEHGLPHRVERTEPGDQDRRHVEMGCIRPGAAPSAQKGWGLESAGSADCLSQRAPLHVGVPRPNRRFFCIVGRDAHVADEHVRKTPESLFSYGTP